VSIFLSPLAFGSGLIQLMILYTSGPKSATGSRAEHYIDVVIPAIFCLLSFEGIVIVSSICIFGLDLSLAFNLLVEYERKWNCRKTNSRHLLHKTKSDEIFGAFLCLEIVFAFCIFLEIVTLFVAISGIHPIELIAMRFDSLRIPPYLVKFVIFTCIWIQLTEILRLALLITLIMMTVLKTVSSCLDGIKEYWKSQSLCFILSGNRKLLQSYKELSLACDVFIHGVFTMVSVIIFVVLGVVTAFNFLFIRLSSSLPLWFLPLVPITSFVCAYIAYFGLTELADLHTDSENLIRIWRNSSNILVSRKYMYKSSLALRPLRFSIGFVWSNFRIIDRSMIAGYFSKLVDYTIVALLAIP
jgi:hypothetical protein